jgi:hypothetical protein
VFGLDAGTGDVRWRHYVGPEMTVAPIRVTDDPDADVLLVDAHHQQLVRCNATDGQPAWRLPVGEPFAGPVAAGRKIYVAAESGRLLEVDTSTGESPQHVSIPQRLLVGPAVAPNRPRAFQVGEHSNVYVISTDTLECIDVVYLGHKPGTVQLPPLVLMSFVFIVENAGSDYALLHVLSIRDDDDGPSLRSAQSPIRLTGNVRVPLVTYGRRLLLLTDRGEIRVWDVDINDVDEPVKDAATLPPMYEQPVMGYPLTEARSLWVADNRLTKYDVQVTTKQITRNPTITNVGDTFVGPLQMFRDVLVHVRRVKNSAGTTAAAIQIDNPRKPRWQTQLAVPVTHVAADPAQGVVRAVSAAGSLFQMDRDTLAKGGSVPPIASAAVAGPASFSTAVPLGDGRAVLLNPAVPQRMLLYETSGERASVTGVDVKVPLGEPAGEPVAFQNSLLLPTREGGVHLINPSSGEQQLLPFQPKLEPGAQLRWQRPAVVGAEGREFVIADDRRSVYRVGIKDQPQPFLAEMAQARLEEEIVAPCASLGQTVYTVTRAEDQDRISAIEVGELKIANQWELQGARVTWGPRRVGDVVLLVVDGTSLWCFDGGEKPRWDTPPTIPATPVGDPLAIDGDFVFAAADGTVWRIAGASGQSVATVPLGEPLDAGPFSFGDLLLLVGTGGALHVIPIPTSS